jgi:NitT/TauT family transport system substrate-binding protein
MMKRMKPSLRITITVCAVMLAVTVLHKKPWRMRDAAAAGELEVGFLPVTCHLTCPVTDYATRTTTSSTRFVSERFSDFPTVVEALKARKIDATFILAPLAMVLIEQHVPIKIVYLGHRDGSTVIVRKDSDARSIRDLRGKVFAVPSHFSNQYLVITKLMEDNGMSPDEIEFRDMAPPDMPSSLAAHAIDAYFVGEPMAAKAEMDGTGRVLYYAKDIWPHFISCVLVVRDELIDEQPQVVRDLVRGIAESGEWAETHRLEAAKVAAPYYRQDEKLLRFVLTEPPDRVSYRQLTPSDDDMKQIMHYAIKAGILHHEIDLGELLDRRFIPDHIEPARITVK